MTRPYALQHMRDKTALNLWIVAALLATVGLGIVSLQQALLPSVALTARVLAGSFILLGACRILALARLMYRAGKVPLAGKWILFACLTAAVAILWITGPLFRT
jgi:hypothetical protein